jgi:hypothetical protein
MITVSPGAAAFVAVVAAAWLCLACWATMRGLRLSREGAALRAEALRSEAFLAAAPAIPLLVASDMTLQGTRRLTNLLGLSGAPASISELSGQDVGLCAGDAELLTEAVRTSAAIGGAFRLAVRPQGSTRVFLVRGEPAPVPAPEGSTLLWFIDQTEGEEERAALAARVWRERSMHSPAWLKLRRFRFGTGGRICASQWSTALMSLRWKPKRPRRWFRAVSN